MLQQLQLYLSRQAVSVPRYLWEQTLQAAVGWVPGLVGLGLRAFVYRAILRAEGYVAI